MESVFCLRLSFTYMFICSNVFSLYLLFTRWSPASSTSITTLTSYQLKHLSTSIPVKPTSISILSNIPNFDLKSCQTKFDLHSCHQFQFLQTEQIEVDSSKFISSFQSIRLKLIYILNSLFSSIFKPRTYSLIRQPFQNQLN